MRPQGHSQDRTGVCAWAVEAVHVVRRQGREVTSNDANAIGNMNDGMDGEMNPHKNKTETGNKNEKKWRQLTMCTLVSSLGKVSNAQIQISTSILKCWSLKTKSQIQNITPHTKQQLPLVQSIRGAASTNRISISNCQQIKASPFTNGHRKIQGPTNDVESPSLARPNPTNLFLFDRSRSIAYYPVDTGNWLRVDRRVSESKSKAKRNKASQRLCRDTRSAPLEIARRNQEYSSALNLAGVV